MVVLLLLLLLLLKCAPRQDEPTRQQGQDSSVSQPGITGLEQRKVYPGGSFVLTFAPGGPLQADAERGSIEPSGNPGEYLYTAPLENYDDQISFYNADDGEPIAAGTVQIQMPETSELELLQMGEELLDARFGTVLIQGRMVDGVTEVVYRDTASGSELQVQMFDDNRASLEWNGHTLDGRGPLSADEREALNDLATGPLARALTMVAADLGCLDGAAEISQPIHAGLIFPWQMVLKYLVAYRADVITHFLGQSSCAFSDAPIEAGEKPFNTAIFWNSDIAIPGTIFFFPFDGEGQMEGVDR